MFGFLFIKNKTKQKKVQPKLLLKNVCKQESNASQLPV
jgi:hypothetical protein